MYLFLHFVVAIVSIYFLGYMCNTHGTDTTLATPVAIMLLYSLLNVCVGVKKWNDKLLADDWYRSTPSRNSYNSASYNKGGSSNSYEYNYDNISYKPKETVEYFSKPKVKTRTYEKQMTHYPSNKEIKEKIANLEKSRWFRIKRSLCNFIGNDITAKYYKPYTVIEKVVEPIEDYSAYQPQPGCWQKKEMEEYNEVAKQLSRSCEFVIDFETQETINE